ncbi:hypothetical protein DITRI_Ditri13aG0072400 [Diplodiscus trichospermus]
MGKQQSNEALKMTPTNNGFESPTRISHSKQVAWADIASDDDNDVHQENKSTDKITCNNKDIFTNEGLRDQGCSKSCYTNNAAIHVRNLWRALLEDNNNEPWLFMGDFNATLGSHETTGNLSRITSEEFCTFITDCGLHEIENHGNNYTWHARREGRIIMSKLDRSLCNNGFLDLWTQISSCVLPCSNSNHNPLLISCLDNVIHGPRPFPFHGMWTKHKDFLSFVASKWSASLQGNPLHVFIMKLKALKQALKIWNKDVFWDINVKVKEDMENLNRVQCQLSNNCSDEIVQQEKC